MIIRVIRVATDSRFIRIISVIGGYNTVIRVIRVINDVVTLTK